MRVAAVAGSTSFLQSIGCLWVALGITVTCQAYGAPPFVAILVSLPLYVLWTFISIPASVMVTNVMLMCVDLFFREVISRNTYKVPVKSPVLFVCAPHGNQLLDPLVVMRTCPRQTGFLCAAKTMRKSFIGYIARALDSIPVERAQDLKRAGTGAVTIEGDVVHGLGTRFAAELRARDRIVVGGLELAVKEVASDTEALLKAPPPAGALPPETSATPAPFCVLPHVDSSLLYEAVFDRLGASECVGIFPEGGSHDRTELLPLKMGVSIMALGASARFPGLPIRIVPVGLHYFQGHRFRGAVLVDYGEPIVVPPELVAAYERGGAQMKEACETLLHVVEQALTSVTISAPDYATLELFWMMRRLHTQATLESTGARPTLSQQVALTKAFSRGWERVSAQPGTAALQRLVASYNTQLRLYGIRDYHVEACTRIDNSTLLRALLLWVRMLFNGLVALPGLLLGLPLLVVTRYVSESERLKAVKSSSVKVYGRDVVATYKVLISLVMTPLLHVLYTGLVWRLVSQRAGVAYMFFSPFVCWGAVRCAESSKLAYREAWAIVSALLKPTSLHELRRTRREIKAGVLALFDDIGAMAPNGGRIAEGGGSGEGGGLTPEPPEQWLELCESLRRDSLRHRKSGIPREL